MTNIIYKTINTFCLIIRDSLLMINVLFILELLLVKLRYNQSNNLQVNILIINYYVKLSVFNKELAA